MEKKETLKKQKLTIERDGMPYTIFLLGADSRQSMYWLYLPDIREDRASNLEKVATFYFDDPKRRGIKSQGLVSNALLGMQPFDDDMRDWRPVTNIYDSPRLVSTTFTSDEGWLLTRILQQMKVFGETAHLCQGDYAMSTCLKIKLPKATEVWPKIICKSILPKLVKELVNILTPKEESHELASD